MIQFYLTYFIVQATFAVITPFLPVVLANLGFSVSQVGLGMGCFEAVGIVGPLAVGLLAERTGRFRSFDALSLFFSALLFGGFVLKLPGWLYFLILGSLGFCFRANAPLLDSISMDAVQGDSQKYTGIRSAGTMGFVILSVAMSVAGIPAPSDNKAIAITFGLVCCLGVLAIILLPVRYDHLKSCEKIGKDRNTGKWYDNAFVLMLLLIAMSRFSLSAVYSFLSLYALDVAHVPDITILNAVAAGCEFFVMLLAGWLMKKRKLSAYFFLMVGSAAMALRLCLYVWFPTKTGLILSQTLHAFCYGAFHPAALNYIASHVRKDRLGAGISLYFSLASGLPSVVGSMVGGHMVDAFGYARMFYTYAAVSLAAVIIGLIFGKFLRSQDKIAFDVI